MIPEPMFTVLEAYIYFGAILALMIGLFALAGWWQTRVIRSVLWHAFVGVVVVSVA